MVSAAPCSGGSRAIVPLGGDGAFAVAYGSGRIVIQEVGQTNALRTLSAHTSPITACAFRRTTS